MTGPVPLRDDQIERQARLTVAFAEAGIGSSAALYALVASIYRRAPALFARAQRVAFISRQIGEELCLDDRTLAVIERASWTANLGTLVMDDNRIADGWDRTDMWTLGERARIAADIVAAAPFLVRTADVVRASRECFDGTGFPMRLQGQCIPVGARILHFAEVMDSLTSLCAVFGVSQDAATVEMVRCAGGRLDPDIVAAWLRCSEDPPRGILPGAAPQERHF